MSIQTPTSDVHSPLDVAALAQLAGEFFAALPGERAEPQAALNIAPSPTALGGVPTPVNVLPAGTSLGPFANGPQLPGTIAPAGNAVPQSPQSVLNLGASTPSLVPHSAAPNGVPDHASIVPPAVDGRVGSGSLGVRQAYTASSTPSLPAVGGASPERAEAIGPAHQRSPVPSTPYYFLGESAGYPTTLHSFEVPREDRVSAQSFGLPGADDLRALLSDNPRHQAQPLPAHAPTTATEQPTSPYYFAQPTRQAHGFSERVPQADESRLRALTCMRCVVISQCCKNV